MKYMTVFYLKKKKNEERILFLLERFKEIQYILCRILRGKTKVTFLGFAKAVWITHYLENVTTKIKDFTFSALFKIP